MDETTVTSDYTPSPRDVRPYPEGWGSPLNARKPHYFIQHASLCGKWIYMGEDVGEPLSGDGCNLCSRLIAERCSRLLGRQ